MNRLTVCSFHAIELYQKYNNYDAVTGRQRQTGSVYKCQRIKKKERKRLLKRHHLSSGHTATVSLALFHLLKSLII